MKKSDDWSLPVVFYFTVRFEGNPPIGEVAFKSVSGLDTEIELETVKEGGNNNFEYKLPKQIKHGNLVLKGAMMPVKNKLGQWVKNTLENLLHKPVSPKNIIVNLLNGDGDPMYRWQCVNAYPVKWNVEGFDAEKNEIAIESIEFAYTTLIREQ